MAAEFAKDRLQGVKEWLADGDIHLDQYMLLKAGSIFAGAILLLGGALGTTSMFLGGGFAYFIGSLYAIVFGLMVVVVELKKSERSQYVEYAYEWIDIYLKFMTLQRGKGVFYLGVGILVFFIGPDYDSDKWIRPWGVNNVGALCLAAAGFVHTMRMVKEDHPVAPTTSNLGLTPSGFQLTGVNDMDFNSPYSGPAGDDSNSTVSAHTNNPFLQRS